MNNKVTAIDIANRLGISVATVSRAFQENGNIAAKTKSKVLLAAAEMGYRSNQVTRALHQKATTFGVLLVSTVSGFVSEVLQGMQTACDELAEYNVNIIPKYLNANFDDCPELVLDILHEFEKTCSGIILLLSCKSEIIKAELSRISQQIPVAFVCNDSGYARVLQVSSDGTCAGSLAGEILGCCKSAPRIAILAGNTKIDIQLSTVMGTQWFASANGFPAPKVFEHFNDPQKCDVLLREIAASHEFDAVYLSTSVTFSDINLAESFHKGGISIVATDISEMNMNLLKKRLIRAIVFRDPFMQGKKAVENLHFYLMYNKAKSFLVRPRLLFASDIEFQEKQ